MKQDSPSQRPAPRTIDPLTAAGALIALIAATALITYAALILPGKLVAASGPPEKFRVAATQQALHIAEGTPPLTGTHQSQNNFSSSGDPSTDDENVSGTPAPPSDSEGRAAIWPTPQPTTNPYGEWPVPENMDADYWLSMPTIGVEAPIIAFTPWEREVDGVTVLRLPVPNFYGVSWDVRSSEPGFGGNTVLTGHSNLYGGVFGDLDELSYGDEVAIWSEYGVYSYYVSQIEYIPDNDQPLEVRLQNASWMQQTFDSRVTLITCWPASDSTHRLIVVATR
jgi:LPXTG-site transpeptidase (sortase) family protein